MRYTLTSASGPARRLFKEEVVYDDRQIVAKSRRDGLVVTRPNGREQVRGSSRLIVWSGGRIVAKFERQDMVEDRVIQPEPIGAIKGRQI